MTRLWTCSSPQTQNLPDQYAFVLLPCYKSDCIHAVCQKGRPVTSLAWFTDGPPLTYFPLPIPDPARPWGGECSECQSFCAGHYMSPEENIKHVLMHGTNECIKEPPSVTIRKYYDTKRKHHMQVNDQQSISELAKETLLPLSDVEMWLQHLSDVSDRRKAGAVKAAATQQSKRRSHG